MTAPVPGPNGPTPRCSCVPPRPAKPVVEVGGHVRQRLVPQVADVRRRSAPASCATAAGRCAARARCGRRRPRPRRPAGTAAGRRPRCGSSRSPASAGSKTSARSVSSAVWICASATITASSRCATSASASTMSIGGVVPISTRARVLRSDSCASSSDCCCTRSEAMRVRQVPVRVAHRAQRGRDGLPQLDVGDLAVLQRLTATCCRMLSMLNPRSSGCVEAERQRRAKLGREVGEGVVGGQPRPVPADAVLRAPLQRLLDAEGVDEPVVRRLQPLAAGQEAVVRRIGAGGLKRVRQASATTRRGPATTFRSSTCGSNLRDLDAQVVLEGQLDGFLHRQPPRLGPACGPPAPRVARALDWAWAVGGPASRRAA